jgi:hypothetical protein
MKVYVGIAEVVAMDNMEGTEDRRYYVNLYKDQECENPAGDAEIFFSYNEAYDFANNLYDKYDIADIIDY